MIDTLKIWHEILETGDTEKLESILAEDAVMISPVVFSPQKGKAITLMYLSAATKVFNNGHFKYIRQLSDEHGVAMEFETEIDGVYINGIDLVKWNQDGLITEFKVMLRPLQAVNMIHQKMGEMLQQLSV